jgi:predicted Zn-ribbon and HTH transcriptional regulator
MGMAGNDFGGRLSRYVSAIAKTRMIPDEPPEIPVGMLESIAANVTLQEAPFLSHLARVRVEWLEGDADRLGNTCFEMPPHEVEIRKRQRMSPGQVTVSLHPILAEDEKLFAHTLAHELLHAAGMTEHDERHSALVNEIAPSPTLSESQLLQDIRNQALAQQEVKDWTCGHCGFIWDRTTVKAPSRCPKCARPFK